MRAQKCIKLEQQDSGTHPLLRSTASKNQVVMVPMGANQWSKVQVTTSSSGNWKQIGIIVLTPCDNVKSIIKSKMSGSISILINTYAFRRIRRILKRAKHTTWWTMHRIKSTQTSLPAQPDFFEPAGNVGLLSRTKTGVLRYKWCRKAVDSI